MLLVHRTYLFSFSYRSTRLVAFSAIGEALKTFEEAVPRGDWESISSDTSMAGAVAGLDALLSSVQDPSSYDKVEAIRKELDSTKEVLVKDR